MKNFKLAIGTRPRQAAVCGILVLVIAVCASAYNKHLRQTQTRPVISGTPPTSDLVGQAYNFTPTASGPSGYTLTFSISGRPAWASFNSSTGQLSGTPTMANVGTYSNIVITVSDGLSKSSLAPFSISVTSPNTPPTISGQPVTSINAGTAYSFTPSASDTDGDKLTFSVQNLPSWATFNTATGQLSGTPTAAYVGAYSNIIISVSDGVTSASLTAFAITVNQVSTGSVTLSWTPPTQNTNGTTLTDLAGYRIYYGTSSSNLNQVIQVANAGVATYVVDNLSSATWYFGMTAYDSAGTESTLSNLGTVTVP